MSSSRRLTLARINDITTRINSVQDLHSLLTTIMDAARELLNVEASSLLLYDRESDELIFDIARGSRGGLLAHRRIQPGEGIAGACAQSRTPIIVNDAAQDERVLKAIDRELDFVTRNLLAVPMLARGEMIGVLEVLNTADDRDFSESDVRLLLYLSNMAALAIYNRKLYDDLKDRADELHCVYEISQKLNVAESMDEALDGVLASIEEVLGSRRCSAFIANPATREIEAIRVRGYALAPEERNSVTENSVSDIVMRTGDPLLVRDMEKEEKIRSSPERGYKTRSFVSVPILLAEKTIGVLHVADKKDDQPYDFFELKVLAAIAARLSDAYSRFVSREKEMQLISYRRDLETAAMIQSYGLPRLPSRLGGMEIAARYEASLEVGGDFYDLIYHSEDRQSLVMADVAGKGVPAALFMEFSKTLLAGQAARNIDPVTSLVKANKEIFNRSQMAIFVTVFLVQIERDMRRLRYCSAGHNRQILCRKNEDSPRLLITKGPPLGIREEAEFIEEVLEYEPGDLLALFTDGVTEAANPEFEEFGEERLIEFLNERKGEPLDVLMEQIYRELNRFRDGMALQDDTTVLLIRL